MLECAPRTHTEGWAAFSSMPCTRCRGGTLVRGGELEHRRPRNVPLYQHCGYEVTSHERVSDDLETWILSGKTTRPIGRRTRDEYEGRDRPAFRPDVQGRRGEPGWDHTEQSLAQPSPGGNCANWILGHLTNVQNGVMQLLGEKPVWKAGSSRGRGSTPSRADQRDRLEYPQGPVPRVARSVHAAISSLSTKPSPSPFRIPSVAPATVPSS